jgi:hypothetical protein
VHERPCALPDHESTVEDVRALSKTSASLLALTFVAVLVAAILVSVGPSSSTKTPHNLLFAQRAVDRASASTHKVTDSELARAAATTPYQFLQYPGSMSTYPHLAVIEVTASMDFFCANFPAGTSGQVVSVTCPSSVQQKYQSSKNTYLASQSALRVATVVAARTYLAHRVPVLADYRSGVKAPVTMVSNSRRPGVLVFRVRRDKVTYLICVTAPMKINGPIALYGTNGAGPC